MCERDGDGSSSKIASKHPTWRWAVEKSKVVVKRVIPRYEAAEKRPELPQVLASSEDS